MFEVKATQICPRVGLKVEVKASPQEPHPWLLLQYQKKSAFSIFQSL